MRAIRSVLAQTLRDWELIVVVDGNDPPTLTVLDGIADSRVRYIVHAEKRGAGPARDTGANASTARWVAFLDDDDEWHPEKVQRQLSAAQSEQTVLMTLFRVKTRDGGELVSPSLPYDGRMPIDEWLFGRQTWMQAREAMVQTSGLMFPRVMFDTLRFRDTKQHEEWELVIRAVKQLGYAFVTVPEALVTYYEPYNGPSLSKTYTLERSMQWLNEIGDLVTPRAYSGFALTVAPKVPSDRTRWQSFSELFTAALSKGAPTARQLFAFALIVALPPAVRLRLRAAFAALAS
jgi:glycosyltransferase involved in cell wall biosynthesis